ncbi:MAG: serine/threonine protein kinase [Symploca sp. SIO2C1]|nr:serine/threonine protein kinase [Symploca sp. SIO2C1]
MPSSLALASGSIIENRYRIVRELGSGGFGRTYLAEDLNRYNERCVLKEFAPQSQSNKELHKAQELFQREAGMLYHLKHPQIPRFRELIRLKLEGNDSLLLVQDYVEGLTYSQLLEQGKRFSEAEVIQLLRQLLPVLEYLHSQQVVHRDISPDNLIHRSSDGKPVLIDFGCVKQVVVTATSHSSPMGVGTVVGKKGYAPDEQLREGNAYPCSDLYALGVTVLVLLTGKQPGELYDLSKGNWSWQQEVSLSSTLNSVLKKMLAYLPRDRYQSAKEVLEALENYNPSQTSGVPVPVATNLQPSPPKSILGHAQTLVVAPGKKVLTTFTSFFNKKQQSTTNELQVIRKVMTIALLTIVAIVGIAKLGSSLLQLPKFKLPEIPPLPEIDLPEIDLPNESKPSLNASEQERQRKIVQRVKALNQDEGIFYQQVNELFYAQHPEIQGRSLTNKPEDAKLREDWYQVAEELLEELEQR